MVHYWALLSGQIDRTRFNSDVSSNAASPSLPAHNRFSHPENGDSRTQRSQDNLYDVVIGVGNSGISDLDRNSCSSAYSLGTTSPVLSPVPSWSAVSQIP
ncbi:hypothetical protein F4823DRAFT_318543 [Ustulina deusta]|nr:hypothetical protein F4823DRAFT_318543 [Ustulina deusta]